MDANKTWHIVIMNSQASLENINSTYHIYGVLKYHCM